MILCPMPRSDVSATEMMSGIPSATTGYVKKSKNATAMPPPKRTAGHLSSVNRSYLSMIAVIIRVMQ